MDPVIIIFMCCTLYVCFYYVFSIRNMDFINYKIELFCFCMMPVTLIFWGS